MATQNIDLTSLPTRLNVGYFWVVHCDAYRNIFLKIRFNIIFIPLTLVYFTTLSVAKLIPPNELENIWKEAAVS
jgi:hypothetical protein